MIVPVVPMELTKWVMRPPVCSQSSGPVPPWCDSGLSGLPNWSSTMPSPSACSCSARSRAASIAPGGTSMSSAPYARMDARRSSLMLLGMIRRSL